MLLIVTLWLYCYVHWQSQLWTCWLGECSQIIAYTMSLDLYNVQFLFSQALLLADVSSDNWVAFRWTTDNCKIKGVLASEWGWIQKHKSVYAKWWMNQYVYTETPTEWLAPLYCNIRRGHGWRSHRRRRDILWVASLGCSRVPLYKLILALRYSNSHTLT